MRKTVDDLELQAPSDVSKTEILPNPDVDPALPLTERDPSADVPPTQRDPSLARRRRRWPWVLLAIAVLFAGAALYVYRVVLRPTPTAHRHVPAGTSVAVRADALRVLLWKPVRQHLWPIALETGDGEEPADSRRARLIHEKTGVRVPLDFREVIAASVDGTSWVAIIGGTIEPGRFVSGLAEVLRAEGVSGWRLDNDVLVHERGPTIGQAEDGTILLGTDMNVVRAALPASEDDEAAALPLPQDGAVTFAVHKRAYRALLSTLPLTLPGLDALGQIEHVRGSFALSDAPRLSIEAQPREGVDPKALASDISAALLKLRLATLLVSTDLYGAKQAISDAKTRTEDGRVLVEAPWPYEALDRAVKTFAEALRDGA
ncbi:MAG TPA: hypothetical protein VFB62_00695 [Polyangiaceae bacterium]|nr:hypothetical protein [Polyangiaceae bacterium]